MPNKFKVCHKCKATNIDTLVPKLEQLDPNAKIKIGCQSYCGPGKKKPFVIVNDKVVSSKKEEKLIEKVEKRMKK
ncbi:DUF1450 domain-containing protein [Salipaludibacillus daqingensis]|uniref:DUF1450 domain-containing protein n=1 Tax=Salipaludibacillus daqingensis TaxID=3041001 RepID=UPI0024770FB6|nr:DUF1450 domain-containing protein [Salipaludibacillus daqingensis]